MAAQETLEVGTVMTEINAKAEAILPRTDVIAGLVEFDDPYDDHAIAYIDIDSRGRE
jgi:hypothetical protein